MSKKLQVFLAVISVISILTLCACKNTDVTQDNSSNPEQVSNSISQVADSSSSESVSSTVSVSSSNTLPSSGAEDPQNTDTNREEGTIVSTENLQPISGKANGIDVSKWQGKIDWSKVSKAGIDFAIIRIGYRDGNGNIYKDDNADYNIQQAQKSGILLGVYFFSTAINTSEAAEEAKWVAEAIKGYKISYPVAYDCEGFSSPQSRMYNLTANERTNNAISFLSEIEKSGYTGMFYASKSDLENPSAWDTQKIEECYKIWIAHYPASTYPQVKNPEYLGRYDMWQYTNRGTVSGIDSNTDMIVSYFVCDEAKPKDASVNIEQADAPKSEEEKLYTAVSDSVTAKDIVNLREGPSTSYNVVSQLKSGTFLKRTAIGSNGWSKLLLNGKTVYAITSYLTDKVIEQPKEEEQDIVNDMLFHSVSDEVTAKETVNLRSLPTTDSKIVGTLKNGTFLKRTAESDKGWSRLDFNGKTVYAVSSYLTTDKNYTSSDVSPATSSTADEMSFHSKSGKLTAKTETNLRTAPTTENSQIVYTLKNGEYLECTGYSDRGWTRLIYNGQTVYAISSYLTE